MFCYEQKSHKFCLPFVIRHVHIKILLQIKRNIIEKRKPNGNLEKLEIKRNRNSNDFSTKKLLQKDSYVRIE